MTTQQFLVSTWSWDGAAVVFSAMAVLAYVWRFGVNGRMLYLLAAVGGFLLIRISPLNALAAGYLFSAHMLQHILLLLVVPALALMSLPRHAALAWGRALPAHTLMAWLAGVGAMWLWHARPLCNAAVSSRLVSALQIGSLLVLGAIFWRPILAPRETERMSPPGAVFYLFSACVACSILGILITFSPVNVCPIYLQPPSGNRAVLELIQHNWGITPEKDQQIGGLLMWVPMCLVYLGAIVAQLARWFAQPLAGPRTAERGLS